MHLGKVTIQFIFDESVFYCAQLQDGYEEQQILTFS